MVHGSTHMQALYVYVIVTEVNLSALLDHLSSG